MAVCDVYILSVLFLPYNQEFRAKIYLSHISRAETIFESRIYRAIILFH